jgi:hypothetical protein
VSASSSSGLPPVLYKGEPLDPDRGPGLGCFWLQLVLLAVFVVLTPLSVVWDWPSPLSAALLFVVIGLLLLSGQTVIFLLRLVAAERRRGRRRPLAARTPTVGDLEATEPPEGHRGKHQALAGSPGDGDGQPGSMQE